MLEVRRDATGPGDGEGVEARRPGGHVNPFAVPRGWQRGGSPLSFPGSLWTRTYTEAAGMGGHRGRCDTPRPGRHRGHRRPCPRLPRKHKPQVLWGLGVAEPQVARAAVRPWLQAQLGQATRAHGDKDVHASGEITPRGHGQQKPREGCSCSGERERTVTGVLGRVRPPQLR